MLANVSNFAHVAKCFAKYGAPCVAIQTIAFWRKFPGTFYNPNLADTIGHHYHSYFMGLFEHVKPAHPQIIVRQVDCHCLHKSKPAFAVCHGHVLQIVRTSRPHMFDQQQLSPSHFILWCDSAFISSCSISKKTIV